MNDTTNFNIDSLLDGTLDDLADKPEFKPFPVGTHRVIFGKFEQKKMGTHPGIDVKVTAKETLELANPNADAPLSDGDTTNFGFILDNEYGQGDFKMVMKAAAEKFGTKSNRELMEEMNGAEALIVTNQRQNKEKTQTFTGLVAVQLV